uniref:Uncharacterized protein n=1 Tax=Mus musculus TaxID=10090 RepID=Q9D919_MOUSE|nr:unnamed protein product [Mus musculus]
MIFIQAACRPLGRNVPSSSWSMFGRCRRSWPDCTSAWMCVGRKRTRKKRRMGSQKACLRSRRRQWLTATWTSCLAIWKILAIPYRSYTWQRMLSLRTSQLRRCRLNSSATLLFKL